MGRLRILRSVTFRCGPPVPRHVSTLAEERERARRWATTIVSAAIGIAGLTLAFFGVVLLVRGGVAFLILSILLVVGGLLLAALGFFFQLVPFRIQELAEGKRDQDRRRAAERSAPPSSARDESEE